MINNETEKWIEQMISKPSMLSRAPECMIFILFQTIKTRIKYIIERIDNDNTI